MRAVVAPALAVSAVLSLLPAAAETLTVDQIVALSGAGLGDDAIVAKVKTAGARFDLSADDMIALKARGVSAR